MEDKVSPVIKTLAYSDIFNTPLTKEELHKLLHTRKKVSAAALDKLLVSSKGSIHKKRGYYYLSGRENIVAAREKNLQNYLYKYNSARVVAKLFSNIPTVFFVGLTGSVAAKNPGNDDIDLFIITKKGSLYITRLILLIILSFSGLRRKKNDINVNNKICINIFCDTDRIDQFAKKQNMYLAREIAQMNPLFEREKTYKQFMDKNNWISSFLANFKPAVPLMIGSTSRYADALRIFEISARLLQQQIMRFHGDKGDISNNILTFFPTNTQVDVLSKYMKKIETVRKNP